MSATPPLIPLALAATLALATLALAASDAHAAPGDIELSLTSEALVLASDTVAATATGRVAFTPSLRVGYSPIERLTVIAGWRSVTAMSRADRGYELTTSGDALALGARYSLGLHPIFDLHAEADVELMHTDFSLEIAGQRAATSDWGFGFIPKAVASATADLDFITLDLRLFFGFALRTDLAADGLRPRAAASASQVAALDLGRVNLSGLVFGANLAIIF
jgi:hypothetical protein